MKVTMEEKKRERATGQGRNSQEKLLLETPEEEWENASRGGDVFAITGEKKKTGINDGARS